MRPLIHAGEEPLEAAEWFARERPDAIITGGAAHVRQLARQLGLSLKGPVTFAATAIRSIEPGVPGISELPEEIGARAVELLASLILRGEKGVPAVPMVTMIQGRWLESTPAPRARQKNQAGVSTRKK